MRRIASLVLVLVLAVSAAFAAPRYPAVSDTVADNAAVLSVSAVSDIRQYAARLDVKTNVKLYIVTVDFLDGYTMDEYLTGLKEQWQLNDNAILLLMAIGNECYGLYTGSDVKVSGSVLKKTLANDFDKKFLAGEYDQAVTDWIPAMNDEINKCYGTRISCEGLFGVYEPSATAVPGSDRASSRREVKTYNGDDDDDGITPGTIIMTLILLSFVFAGSKKGYRMTHRGRNMGCGCMPFSRLLALFGLWKIWGRRR